MKIIGGTIIPKPTGLPYTPLPKPPGFHQNVPIYQHEQYQQ